MPGAGDECPPREYMAVVVGANRGLGLAICQALVKSGRTVIGVSRSGSKGELPKAGVEEICDVDITKDECMDSMLKSLKSVLCDKRVRLCTGMSSPVSLNIR